MTENDKKLLLTDLCARLPYRPKGVKLHILFDPEDITIIGYTGRFVETHNDEIPVENVRLYLRPMSSMTEEERIEFSKLLAKRYCEEDWEGHISISYCIEIDNIYTDDSEGIKYPSSFSMKPIDWLNSHYFDYRGLIEKDLAIEVTEENNPYNIN